MALKRKINKTEFDALDKTIQALYSAEGSEYELQVDVSDLTSKVDEFRNNNKKLFVEVEELKKTLSKFDGLDIEAAKKAMEMAAKMEDENDKKLLKEGKFEDVLNKRVEAMRQDFTTQVKIKDKMLSDISAEREALQSQLGSLMVETAVNSHVSKVGKVRPGALDDVLHRARSTWRVEGGKLVVKKSDGSAEFGKKGEPLTIEEWAQSLLVSAPHLFEGSSGGGANGGKKDAGGVTKTITGDPVEFGKNLADIAAGKVTVARP